MEDAIRKILKTLQFHEGKADPNTVNNRSPQLEDGYLRIANELFDAITIYPFTAGEYKILFAIIRFTYGYNRKMSYVSIRALMEKTALSRRYALKVLKRLKGSQVIAITKFRNKNIVGINKNYREWRLVDNPISSGAIVHLLQQKDEESEAGSTSVP